MKGELGSKFKRPPPSNHTCSVAFGQKVRQAEVGNWSRNPHGNTMVKYMKVILRPLKLYSVAVWVFFPDTNLRLSQFLFKYDIECMVSWLRRSEIWPDLTLQVAALLNITRVSLDSPQLSVWLFPSCQEGRRFREKFSLFLRWPIRESRLRRNSLSIEN